MFRWCRFFFRNLLCGLLLSNLIFPTQLIAQSLLPEGQPIFRESKEKKKSLSELEESIERSRMIRYSQERWNEMRKRLETGEPLVHRPLREVLETPKRVLPPPPPPGPGLNVVLPYESGLSISGRKVIDFKLSATLFNEEDRGKGRINKTDFQLDQQLQVRVKGTVGRKVTVNVDYDDTRRDEQRSVSVLYTGDPDEVLQEAAFGDITISLPGTEFVQYSKSIFGMRAQLLFRPRTGFAKLFPSHLWHRYTPKEIKLYFIGSRTKGITQTKRFTGQSELKRAGPNGEGINDISYLRRQVFQLSFATGPGTTSDLEHRPIKVGSERIFLDDQNPFNNNIDETTRTFRVWPQDTLMAPGGTQTSTATFTGPAGENTGVFKLLVPGIDYTVDYLKGVIRFLRTLQARDVIVVDYVPQGTNQPPISQSVGGTDPQISNPASDPILGGFRPILLKPDESQFFATRELKNYYDLGAKKIVRDDGRGNFILKIIDTNRNDVTEIVGSSPPAKSVPRYPQEIDVDFENGIFSFVTTDTFRSPNPRPFPDDIYFFKKEDTIPSDKNRYRIFSEYRIRKGNFSLDQFNIVSQSEQVFVDGRKMTRDVDYFIDYDVGIVTFFRPEIIREDSIVEITYDFSPFGGVGEETLVGLRQEWYVTDNFFFGNTFMYNFASRTRGIPDLRSTARSILVLEADVNWKNVKFGKFPVQMKNFSAEVAQSMRNPNTAGKATVETFEGVKLEDAANLHRESWQVAANPEKGNPGTVPAGGAFQPGYATTVSGGRGLFLSNEDWRLLDIDAGLASAVEAADRIQVLKVNYSFQEQNEASSMVQVLNRAGLDFFSHRRQFLELWIHGDNSKNRIQIRLGRISERSDSSTSAAVKTEDKDNNGTLSPGEDVGWSFRNPDGSTTTIGAGNGRLDTQDLNGNGKLDSQDERDGNYLAEVGSLENPLREPNGTVHTEIDWTGWKVFQVPLSIASTAQVEWSSIRDIRFTVINRSSGTTKGELRFGRMAVVGTRFTEPSIEPSTAPVTARVFAENSQDNPGYPTLINHPSYRELYEIEDVTIRRREQALALQYQRNAPTVQITTVTTKQVFTRPLDFSEHETLNFFVHGDLSGNEFIFRIGSPGNYFEYRTELTFSGWRLIRLDILDKNRDGLLDRLLDKGSGVWKRRVGNPSLRNITEITFGVLLPAKGTKDDVPQKIYINELHLTETVVITGKAWRARADFDWPNWGSWGGSWRDVDRNFQTLTSVASGVDSKSGNAFLNVNRLKFLPLNSNFNYSETVTPQIQTVQDPNVLFTVLDEGKVIGRNGNLSGQFLMTQLPWIPDRVKRNFLNIDGSTDWSLANRSAGDREDESLNYRLGSSYSLPWQPDILPTRFLTFRPLPTSISASFGQRNSVQRLASDNTVTASISEEYSLRTAFQFFPRLNLSPSYSYSRALEKREIWRLENAVTPAVARTLGQFDKSANQNVAMGGSFRIFSWLTPSFNYSINTGETYNVNDVIFGTHTFTRGTVKAINRSSNADTSASFSPRDLFQYIRYLRAINPAINSLNFSGGYTISDADTYENVDGGFFVRDKLIIRGVPLNLTGQNPFARRTSLTATDTSRLSGRWNPFEALGFLKSRLWAPLKNFNTSGNFTETRTKRDTTGTQTFSYTRVWPDFIFSTTELERPLFLYRWMTDTRLNGTYQERLAETSGETRTIGKDQRVDYTFTLFRLLQFSIGYSDSFTRDENLRTNQVTKITRSRGINGQVITTLKWGNWRFTPRYDQSQSESEDGTGKKTQDLTTRNASLQVFGDVNVPRFFRLPLGKQLALTNRLILTSSFNFNMIRDGVDETKNRDRIDFNLNGDVEVTPNIRVGFGGTFSRTMIPVKKEADEGFSTYGFNSRITIQF